MKVTIDISDCFVDRLRHWASVGRTLTEARHLIEDHIIDSERAIACEDELRDITNALDALHMSFKDALRQL